MNAPSCEWRAACALAALLVLSGCLASPPARIRAVPLDVPPGRALVLNVSDLPAGYQDTGMPEQRQCAYDRCLDEAMVQLANGTGEARNAIVNAAFSMETEGDAHATVKRFADQSPRENATVTDPRWGDEATLVVTEHDDYLAMRSGTVAWSVARSWGDAPDVPMETIAARLLAKLHRAA